MEKLCKKELCTGCGACAAVCPKGCIRMETDGEGFLHPQIDETNCINCGKCAKACPVLSFHAPVADGFPVAYAAFHQEKEILHRSSSGGVFTALTEQVIKAGGTVYGAAFRTDFSVAHTRAATMEEIGMFRGSKYVQSDCGTVFPCVKQDLEAGKHVLFSGTPCQVAGLRQYLGKDYENLLLVDTTCHSVPSPKAWMRYLAELESNLGSKICGVNFRDKRTGWEKYQMCIQLDDGRELLYPRSQNPYMEAFLRGLISRRSCAHCPFKDQNRASDITLSDFWGVQTAFPEAYQKEGTSLVLVQTEKGQAAFSAVCDQLNTKLTDATAALQGNPAYYVSSAPHTRRDECFGKMDQQSFSALVDQCLAPTPVEIARMKWEQSLPYRAMRKAKRIIRTLLQSGKK